MGTPKRGLINNREYEVIGMKKLTGENAYFLNFIIRSSTDPNGEEVGTLRIPGLMAKTLGRFLLDQIKEEEVKGP